MVITHPTPTNPKVPTACGPSSHSPLPIEMPSAIRLGPITNWTICSTPIRGTLKTSSGSGRSSTPSGGRLTPSGYSSRATSGAGGAVDSGG